MRWSLLVGLERNLSTTLRQRASRLPEQSLTVVDLAGGLIQTTSGSGPRFGIRHTKRSGWSAQAEFEGARALSSAPCRLDRDGHRAWCFMAIPPWRCSALYQEKNDRQKAMAVGSFGEATEDAGMVLQGPELRHRRYGWPSNTWGPLRERVLWRSARSCAVHLLVIGASRSEWQRSAPVARRLACDKCPR